MKLRPHFADTRFGLHVIAIGGISVMFLLGLLMFAFREYCEPILRFALAFISKHGRRYDPENYYLFAVLPFVLAVIFLVMHLYELATKSHTDRQIDAAIRSRLNQTVRGAPIEPD